MKKRIFTLMMAFLSVASGAVWGQTGSITINSVPITTSGGDGWIYEEKADDSNILTIKEAGNYTIKGPGTGSGNNTNIQIILSGQGEYNISFDNFRTDARLGELLDPSPVYNDRCALTINSGANVILSWTGINKFWSSPQCAGINVEKGAKLTLKGNDNDGYLEAGSLNNSDNIHTDGAGIGGDATDADFGTIIIESGVVKARCESKTASEDARAAGIGGGYKDGNPSKAGTIIIKGGVIEAASWSTEVQEDYINNKEGNEYAYGAGIGGGWKGTCTNIAILGGKITANAYSGRGEDIGVGYEYDGGEGITKGIIIGQWDKKTSSPTIGTISGEVSINKENIVQQDGTLIGTVTMPKETQMYKYDAIVALKNTPFNAYSLYLNPSVIDEEGTHSLKDGKEDLDAVQYYYFGADMKFELTELSCTLEHLFMGWIKTDGTEVVPVNAAKATFVTPSKAPEGTIYGAGSQWNVEKLYYNAVWVDNEYSITVKTGTEWKKDGENTPKIAYSPDGSSSDVLSKLNFEFTTNPLPAELTGLQFDGNQLIGTPTLQGAETYKKCDVTASVSLNGGTAKQPISITITVVDENMINSIEVASRNHVYNGLVHNDIPNSGVEGDYLFDAKMTNDITGTPLPEPSPLREGVHYRVYKYSFNGGSIKKAVENSRQSLEVKDAGTYSNITIEALDAVLTNDEYFPILDQTKDLGDAEIVVAKRPMNIDIKFNKQSLEEGEELTWDDVTITPSAYNKTDNTGIVTSEAEDLKVTGNITYTLNEEGTKATVQISNVKVESNETFKVSNYAITINGDQQYTEGTEIDFPDIVIPVNPSSTGGGTDKRYQLYLANKDYLDYGKTEEFYDKLGLELFSRHNKKYEKAGGSFTIWYEKDGVANDGNYRIFWSNRANGEYKEVKFDPVSEYFRIDNVHSDVYVKIYDADGFPVANEAITAQDFRAYAQPNKIIVITPEPTDVQIISMAGAVVAADKVTGQREFANLAEGVYIVRMGETIVKLQVRN